MQYKYKNTKHKQVTDNHKTKFQQTTQTRQHQEPTQPLQTQITQLKQTNPKR